MEHDALQLSAAIVTMSEDGARTLRARTVEFEVEFAEDIEGKVANIPLLSGETIRHVRAHWNGQIVWTPKEGLHPPARGTWQTRKEIVPQLYSAAAVAISAQQAMSSPIQGDGVTVRTQLKSLVMVFERPVTAEHARWHARKKAAELFPAHAGWSAHMIDVECFDPEQMTKG